MSLSLRQPLLTLAALLLVQTLPAQPPIATHFGRNMGDQFGWAVAPAGDVTGDGVSEYLVGAPHDNTVGINHGSVHVFDGVTHTPIYIFDGPGFTDHLGWNVSELGDVNGDGKADILVANPLSDLNATSAGSVHVFDGATGIELYAIHGTQAWDQTGRGLCKLGDIDGDGAADFAIGTPLHDMFLPGGGRVDIVSGATGTFITTITPIINGFLGADLVSPGDVTGDGINDLLVGAPRSNALGVNSGKVSLYAMPSGVLLNTYLPALPGEWMGSSLDAIPDLDGDGLNDFITGAPQATPFGTDSGRAYVFSTGTGAILHSYDGGSLGAQFGFSVAGMEDATGDGIPDFMVGAPWAPGGGIERGVVTLYSGATGAVARVFNSPGDYEYLGYQIAGLPDITGDGLADLLLGAIQYQAAGSFVGGGRAEVFAGVPFSNASLTDLGGGCGFGGLPATVLSGSPPVLGSTTIVQVTSADPGAAVTLFVAPPTTAPWIIGPGCISHVGAAPVNHIPAGIADAMGVSVTPFALPVDPTLEGYSGIMQALTIGTFVQISNGVHWSIGS